MNHTPIPVGWRQIEMGEIILKGDLYSYRDNEWSYYTQVIGRPLASDMFSIRRVDPDAPSPMNKQFVCNYQPYESPKVRVEKYLKKLDKAQIIG